MQEMKQIIYVLNGPNLHRLEERNPHHYGGKSLEQIASDCRAYMSARGNEEVQLAFLQSNYEGDLIDFLWQAHDDHAIGVILNAGGYTHTSVPIRDAIEAIHPPVIEVHLSNIYAREDFRKHSVLSAVCHGSIVGLGRYGYCLAIDGLLSLDHSLRGKVVSS